MEATCFSETSIDFQRGTWSYIADERTPVETRIKEEAMKIGLVEHNFTNVILQIF
jgi:hypothetical protein